MTPEDLWKQIRDGAKNLAESPEADRIKDLFGNLLPEKRLDGKRVIVVGAGIAGLSAAQSLQARGADVTVLEARNRIGGRILTDRSMGIPIDMGPSWIHEHRGNPVTRVARDTGTRTSPSSPDETELYTRNGEGLGLPRSKRLQKLRWGLEEGFQQACRRADDLEKSLLSLEEVSRGTGDRSPSPLAPEVVQWSLDAIPLVEGMEPELVSIRQYNLGESFSGGDLLVLNGYDRITEGLTDEVDIRLHTVVERMEYDTQGGTVFTNRGTWEGDAIVVTLPLGVLKAHKVDFSPRLPSKKLEAIERLGWGELAKIVLRYPRRTWPTEPHFFGRMAHPNPIAMFLNLERFVHEPVLVAFVGGLFARSFAQWPHNAIADAVHQEARALFGADLPEPEDALIKFWSEDPFSLGSYAHMGLESRVSDRLELGKPVRGSLFFAGEATAQKHIGTTHGALLSGIRVAEEIAEAMGRIL